MNAVLLDWRPKRTAHVRVATAFLKKNGDQLVKGCFYRRQRTLHSTSKRSTGSGPTSRCGPKLQKYRQPTSATAANPVTLSTRMIAADQRHIEIVERAEHMALDYIYGYAHDIIHIFLQYLKVTSSPNLTTAYTLLK